MIEVFDNLVDYNVRNRVYLFCTQSKFKLGWEDSDTLEKNSVKNLHSSWSLDEFKESLLEPYIKEAFLKSKNFNYDLSKLWRIELNLVKSDDVHFTHTHRDKIVALYYVNLDWQDGFYGETLFYDSKDNSNITHTSPYVPGRIILFDGNTPHSIRPQSVIAPKFRFTVSIFFNK